MPDLYLLVKEGEEETKQTTEACNLLKQIKGVKIKIRECKIVGSYHPFPMLKVTDQNQLIHGMKNIRQFANSHHANNQMR